MNDSGYHASILDTSRGRRCIHTRQVRVLACHYHRSPCTRDPYRQGKRLLLNCFLRVHLVRVVMHITCACRFRSGAMSLFHTLMICLGIFSYRFI